MTAPLHGDRRNRPARDASIQTFLIADIRGYTRYTSERGDEAAARLAARFADLAGEGIEAGGGQLVELRGDEALAVFGSARGAIRTAVEMQAVFAAERAADPSLPLAVGIGLDAGEAVPVAGGFRGGALNLAARLCSVAGPGEVLASEGVIHLARVVEGIEFERLEPLVVKGIDEPVVAVRIRAVRPEPFVPVDREPALVAGMAEPPSNLELPAGLEPTAGLLVEREADLRWLDWSWRLATLGQGRVINLTGARGIGKTRVVSELAAHIYRPGLRIAYAGYRTETVALGRIAEVALMADTPTLVVADDVDAAGHAAIQDLIATLPGVAERPILVILTASADLPPPLSSLLERLDPAGDRTRQLEPLDLDGVRAIAGSYAEGDLDDVPIEAILADSHGLPGRVHAAIGDWARERASSRLRLTAVRAAAGRTDLRSAETALADDVADLQQLRERARLFAAVDEAEIAAPATGAICPFKGLATFDMQDASYFFGRERLVAEVVARLVGTTMMAVVGPSGSGKSSVVRAGLLPALAMGVLPGSENWRQILARPGEHPVAELVRALHVTGPSTDQTDPARFLDEAVAALPRAARLLVVVDQFEEVFTAVEDEAERAAFVDLLSEAATRPDGRITVVLALRADLYGRCAAYPAVAKALAASHVLVGPLTEDELRRAIELPARQAGLRVEPDLVDALVADVVDEPGGLPLLSTTLLELWQRRDGRTLRMATFGQIGGVKGSVARLAEAAYQLLSSEQQSFARSVLLRLAGPGEGDSVVRRRAPIGEFEVDRNPDAAAVLRVLTDSRLVTIGEGTVEVAHEALLREWPRLVAWLEDDSQGRALHRHLTLASREWSTANRDSAELYRGARLASAIDWTAAGHEGDLNDLERQFLDESRAASEREAVQQRRANRRLRFLLGGTVALLVVALAAGSLAVVQNQTAQREATAAEAQRLGAQALVDPQLDRALLLASEAFNLDDSVPTRSNLLGTLLRVPAAIGMMRGDGDPLTAIAMNPTGTMLAVGDNNGTLLFFDPSTRNRLGQPVSMPGPISDLAFSPDGQTLVLGGTSGQIDELQITGGWLGLVDVGQRTIRTMESLGPDRSVQSISFAPDGAFLVTADNDGEKADIARWDPATGKETKVVVHFSKATLTHVQVLPDGKRVVVAADNDINDTKGGLELIDLSTGADLQSYGDGGTFAVSPDGLTIAIGLSFSGQPGDFVVGSVDRFDSSRVDLRQPHHDVIRGIAFAPDGRTLVTASDDRTAITWHYLSGDRFGNPPDVAQVETFAGHGGAVLRPAFAPDSGTMYSGSPDGSIIAWDLTGDRRLAQPFHGTFEQGPFGPEPAPDAASDRALAEVSPNGQLIVTTEGDRLLKRWDSNSLRPALVSFTGSGAIRSATFLGDGSRLVVGREDGVVEYDLTNPNRAGDPDGLPLPVATGDGTFTSAAVSRDGKTVAAGTDKGWVVVWDRPSRSRTGALEVGRPVRAVDFAPDGRTLAVGLDNGKLQVWDAVSGKNLRTLDGDARSVVATRISPDGRVLAAGGLSGRTSLFDLATGRPLGPPLSGPAGSVVSLAFSSNGQMLAIGGSDGEAAIYDVASQRQIGTILPGKHGDPTAVAFTPDGTRLITAHASGQHFVWAIDPARWKARACLVAGRELTADEWTAALPGRAYADVCPAIPVASPGNQQSGSPGP